MTQQFRICQVNSKGVLAASSMIFDNLEVAQSTVETLNKQHKMFPKDIIHIALPEYLTIEFNV